MGLDRLQNKNTFINTFGVKGVGKLICRAKMPKTAMASLWRITETASTKSR